MRYILFFLLFFSQTIFAHKLPPGFAAVQIADGLDPVDLAVAPDGRVFITEKFGRVLLVKNGELQTDPFLEVQVDNFNERGLSGIALDPDFEDNGYVYVYYTVQGKDHNRISRFTAAGDYALIGSEQVLFDLDSLRGVHHNAGAMDFGPDGKLYVAVGDGSLASTSQDMTTTLGKILRLNPDGSIPTDNPFYDQTEGPARAIWAVGLRNPFAMAADPASGRFFTTDVGGWQFEEVNEIFGGKNYGWPDVEGFLDGQVPPPDYVEPLLAYGHSLGCAAVGVEYYAPQNPMFPPEYHGMLFYSDYCSGKIKMLDPDDGTVSEFASEVDRPLNLFTAPDGTLYFIARGGLQGGSPLANTASSTGQLWRIFYTGSDAPFIAIQPKDQLVPVGEDAHFLTSASGADPLFFQWQKNGVDIPGATEAGFVFETPALADSGSMIRCIVTNASGADTTQSAEIQVTTNQRPTVEIIEPPEGTTYRAGDKIVFRGMANDPEEGNLTAENFRWKIDFHHDSHTHPALGPLSGTMADTLRVPQAGEVSDNVWFRINLTVTDGGGLNRTAQRLVFPEKTSLTIKSQPPGLPVEANGTLSQTPYIVPSVINVFHALEAGETALVNDSIYVFEKWSTGETARQIIFEAPAAPTEITAIFRAESALSDGQGLQAFYYNDRTEVREIVEPYVFSRIDPEINFDWAWSSPDEAELGIDFFQVRWQGYILPIASGETNFHTITDDGVRLWVDSTLIIDHWEGQSATEHTGSIYLEAGQFYPIRMEYMELGGVASAQLLWSGGNLARNFVPSSQLFPDIKINLADEFSVRVFPNPISEKAIMELGSQKKLPLTFEIYDTNGRMYLSEKLIVPDGIVMRKEIDFRNLPSGVYFLKIYGDDVSKVFELVKH